MRNDSKIKGFNILLAAVIIELCIGTGYGWSVFVKPLMENHGWSRSQATVTLSVSLFCNGIGFLLVGYWVDHYPKRLAALGGLLMGAGIASSGLAALAGWRYLMYVGYGVIGGFSISLPYLAALSVGIKWFPHRRGLVSGIVVMGCGMGAALVGLFIPPLILRWGPEMTLFGMGLVFMVVCGSLGLVLQNPPGYRLPTDKPTLTKLFPLEVFGYKRFWGLWTLQFLSMCAGFGLFSQAALLIMEQHRLDLVTAGKIVAAMAVCNGLGRLVWPSLSDKFGRRPVLLLLFVIQGTLFLAITFIPVLWLFVVAICAIPFCYGGYCGTLPAFTADLFGVDKVGRIYGPVISAQTVAGFAGPLLFSELWEISRNYTTPTCIIGAILLSACLLPLIVGRKTLKAQRQAA